MMNERKDRGISVSPDINVFDVTYSEFINYIDKAWKKVYLCADEKKSDTHNRNHPRGSDHDASWQRDRHSGKAGGGLSYRLCGICILCADSASGSGICDKTDNEGALCSGVSCAGGG